LNLKERDLEKLWRNYENLAKMIKSDSLLNLIEEQGQRILECSYSQRANEPFCGVGGLVEYSLELLKTCKKLNEALGYEVNPVSMIKVCLLSEIGRIGDKYNDRFIVCESEWHKEKLGQYFDWNESCTKFNVQDMSLWFAQNYKIELSWEEWQAILLSKEFSSDENKFYAEHRERLSILINISKQAVLKNEKDKINGSFTVPF
jgi:hypothetical protein